MIREFNPSFVNGLIAGAGIVLSLMSFGFLQFVQPLEGIQNVTTTELRVAIVMGAIVFVVAVANQYYNKDDKKPKLSEQEKDSNFSEDVPK